MANNSSPDISAETLARLGSRVGVIAVAVLALTVVMSWDVSMVGAFGTAMGREHYLKGSNVMLGPGVNLARVP